MNKTIVILGSTGSVGKQTVEVALDQGARVAGLCAGRDYKTLEKQARLLKPEFCVLEDEAAAKELRTTLADTDIKVFSGRAATLEAAAFDGADMIFNSIGGSSGLEPTLAAIDAGKPIALANKESIVMAGDIVMSRAREKKVPIIPVDSEHSAIFQCLEHGSDISRILLTASGGPFFGMTREQMSGITPERALAHPTWNMGAKITIDSATLMNKGFEVIEAVHLFDVAPSQVEVIVHRESIIHSMVEYNDHAIIAQLSLPDMRLCAQYALTYPKRVGGLLEPLDLTKIGKLSFYKPDLEAFPLLSLAYRSVGEGGVLCAALVSADEVAVDRFIGGQISFTQIAHVVENVIADFENIKNPTISDIYTAARTAADMAARLSDKIKH